MFSFIVHLLTKPEDKYQPWVYLNKLGMDNNCIFDSEKSIENRVPPKAKFLTDFIKVANVFFGTCEHQRKRNNWYNIGTNTNKFSYGLLIDPNCLL